MAKTFHCDELALANDDSLIEQILLFTDGYGVDTTIITAATPSNMPIEQAAEITRERGRVVVVGLTKMDIPREPFYMKELDLRLSRSYGPGRYDRTYEEEGHDYPLSYVRFTERRNMSSFLELVHGGKIHVEPLISHRFPIEEATVAYDMLNQGSQDGTLGIVLEYAVDSPSADAPIEVPTQPAHAENVVVGVVGAGNYATSNLLPHLRDSGDIVLGTVATASGMTARKTAETFGFRRASDDVEALMTESDAVLIATRHDDHARQVIQALKLGKAVFVEKPLAITQAELTEVEEATRSLRHASLMVGFNRRFAPSVGLLRDHFSSCTEPLNILIRVNAGAIPEDHWIQDAKVGGGRLIGEGCHFVDLAVALAGAPATTVRTVAIPKPDRPPSLWDDFSITLGLANGSIASVVYTSIGDSGLAKEYVEISGGGRSAILHNYQRVDLWDQRRKTTRRYRSMDKGQRAQMLQWIQDLKRGANPIPIAELFNVHSACFAAIRSVRDDCVVRV